jgi:hypothetical protein
MWTGHQRRFSLVRSWSDVARVIGELARYVERNALISCRYFGNAGLGTGTNRAPADACGQLSALIKEDKGVLARVHDRRRDGHLGEQGH